jgi:Ca2+-binding RTX toxin-like protein
MTSSSNTASLAAAIESPTAADDPAAGQVAADFDAGLTGLPDTSLIRLDQLRADPRFSGIDGHGVSVVVIDTGIDLDHPFFGADADQNGVADRIVYSYDFSGSNESNASDTHGHGSNVASIVGSQDGLYRGMAPGVDIIALKVFPDGSTTATNADIQEALDWVVANAAAYNVVAVNMSLGQGDNGNTATSSVFASQLATLVADGVAVVVSSGNSYATYQAEGVALPSADPSAWSVGAVWDRDAGVNFRWSTGAIDYTTSADQIISFSQRSTALTTIFAPGGRITGASWDGGTVTYSGTSQAAPHISGLVADMQQLALQVSGHFLPVDHLKQQMIATSVTIFDGDNENDNVTNTLATYHRVDALAWGNLILDEMFAGTTGDDTLNGTITADTIYGNAGSDILKGNAGNDRIDGGAGKDTLTGGAGRDVFVYALGGGADTIADFSHADGDTLDLSAIAGLSGLAGVLSHATQVGSDTVIDFGAGDSLTLQNVAWPALVADDLYSLFTIEAIGTTRLVQIADSYAMYASGQSTGPELRYAGASVTAGQFGAWAPIAAEGAGSGYRVVWKETGGDQFMLWTTDGAGNYQTETVMPARSYALETLETSFGQDFNGDGTTGVVTTVIEMAGIYGLVLVADTYWMGSYGWAELRYGGIPGTPVTVGRFGEWAPIALEPMAWNVSYKVVWKEGATDYYLVWTTDAGLNYLSQTDVISGHTFAFQSLETTFSQDLNGDGTIGPATSVIESAGVTRLVQVADTYALDASGSSSSPALSYGGTLVTTGTFGTWVPIGAEAVAGGYQVAWKQGSEDQYALWLVDGGGNLLSSPTGIVSGGSLALQGLESALGQDLNGDGTTGYPPVVLEAAGGTTLVQVGSNYHVYPAGGSSGPLLSFGGAPIAVGQFGDWAPIGAAASVAGGYQVAWKLGSADQYAVWLTDVGGNLLSSPTGIVTGGSKTLQAAETSLGQDLNGDGTTGLVTTVIESLGSTTLVQVADTYDLYPSGGVLGPELRFGGSAVTAGQFGAWTPIAAEATPAGYQVVWKMTGAERYAVWLADANGNLLSSPTGVVPGSNPALQSLEPEFNQDLNGDGTNGVTAVLASASTHDGWHL